MEKYEIYTKEERLMIDIAKALAAKQDTADAIKLDHLLLEMESKMGLMDGMEVESNGI